MTRWFRMYDDMLDHPKVQRLPPMLFKAWVNLLCLASRNDGRLPCVDDIAFALRAEIDTCNGWLDELAERGLLDEDGDRLSPHNWNARQFKSDGDPTAAERQRRKRDKDRDEKKYHTPVTRDITPPRDRVETEQKDVVLNVQARDLDLLERQCREAAGVTASPSAGLLNLSPIIRCLDAGASLERDVLPTLRGMQARSIRTWEYAVQAIMDAKASREQPAPVGRATGPPRHERQPDMRQALREHLASLNPDETTPGSPESPGPPVELLAYASG